MNGPAFYHDGRTSARRDVSVWVDHDRFRIQGPEIDLDLPIEAIQIEPPLADVPRHVYLPDGAVCIVDSSFELPARHLFSHRLERWVDRLERRWVSALGAGLFLIAVVWGSVTLLVPVVAQEVAMNINPDLEMQLGREALATLDQIAFGPTALSDSRRAQLAERFARLAALTSDPQRCQLYFRASPKIGPNALALPAGTVVILDELVALAKNDDELAAVMAHELGHVQRRHTLRAVLQSSVVGLLIASIIGDVLSASSVAALPVMVLEARYSRDFEREADSIALHLMDRAGIDRVHFANLLTRLESVDHQQHTYPDFLETHPSFEERTKEASKSSSRPPGE